MISYGSANYVHIVVYCQSGTKTTSVYALDRHYPSTAEYVCVIFMLEFFLGLHVFLCICYKSNYFFLWYHSLSTCYWSGSGDYFKLYFLLNVDCYIECKEGSKNELIKIRKHWNWKIWKLSSGRWVKALVRHSKTNSKNFSICL